MTERGLFEKAWDDTLRVKVISKWILDAAWGSLRHDADVHEALKETAWLGWEASWTPPS